MFQLQKNETLCKCLHEIEENPSQKNDGKNARLINVIAALFARFFKNKKITYLITMMIIVLLELTMTIQNFFEYIYHF